MEIKRMRERGDKCRDGKRKDERMKKGKEGRERRRKKERKEEKGEK